MIKLGQKVRDKVSGFEGVVIARTEWLNGCVRLTLQPKIDKDGKHLDAVTFDEPQLELVDEGINVKSKKTGGPIPQPKRAADPKR